MLNCMSFFLSRTLRLGAWLVLVGFVLTSVEPVAARGVRVDAVEAELVSEVRALSPGSSAWVGLRLKHDKNWHTYWRNPGDSGLPTKIEWALPPGVVILPIEWPIPKRILVPPLANYGYEGEVLLLSEVKVPESFLANTVTLKARADWLVCKDVCIPGGADLSLELPVVPGTPNRDDRWATLFAATRASLPVTLKDLEARAKGNGNQIELSVRVPTLDAGAASKHAYFFAATEGWVEPARAQPVEIDQGWLKLTLPVAVQLTADRKQLDGVLVLDPPIRQGSGEVRGVVLSAKLEGAIVAGMAEPIGGGARASAKPEEFGGLGSELSFGLALALAFLGGVILNLMPCVFPILSIKILGFADQAHGDRGLMRMHGLAFGVGVLIAFGGLGLVLLALRASGEALGWGFQLQSPWVVTLLALLFLALALNLSGVFELLIPLPDGPSKPPRSPMMSSFGAGLLAAVVASPCTAPFMGAALGFALTQSPMIALVVFLALGFGMALPYVLLSWFPAWLKRLPRPGPWLVRLKQFLSFPLYATVVWLAWVLSIQLGTDAVLWLGLGLVALGLACWLWGIGQQGGGVVYRFASAAALLAALAVSYPASVQDAKSLATGSSAAMVKTWEPYSAQRLAELQAAGQPVFVDFTAAWCVTCQVNKKLVLDTAAADAAFRAKSVSLIRADWTRRDAAITLALAELGRNGVPVYVLYRPGKAPLVLPELLQSSVLREALDTL
jgi:thiol:disulfide interchange protein/DsbC/DsbD-like thiol-disulfide interchange protein